MSDEVKKMVANSVKENYVKFKEHFDNLMQKRIQKAFKEATKK